MINCRFDPRAFDKIRNTQKKVRQVVVAANLDLWNGLVGGTPVDTGAAAASWWVMNDGNPPTHPSPPPEDATGIQPSDQSAAILASAGKLTTFANSAEYIRRLEYEGWSPQAPSGWIRAEAGRYPMYIRNRVKQAGG